MDRLSGEYKRFSQLVTFLLGLALAACFNIDKLRLAQQLYADPVLRQSLADAASDYLKKNPAGQDSEASSPAASASSPAPTDAEMKAQVERWTEQRDLLARTVPGATMSPGVPSLERMRNGWLGWLITALAGMLGAPFWFDLLQKLTNLRGAGPKPPSGPVPAEGATP